MLNNKLDAEILSLERKLNLVVQDYTSMKDELRTIKDENSSLKDVIKGKEEQISDFQNKIKISKLVDSIGADENDTPELIKRIDDYIKEIDKCIVHLST